MSKGKPITLTIRKHSADRPIPVEMHQRPRGDPLESKDGAMVAEFSQYVGSDSLMPEILDTLGDFQETLKEMSALDQAHSGGFAEAIQGRVARLEQLIEKLGGSK